MTDTAIHRFKSLDSLRGLACLIVVLHHLGLSVPETFRTRFVEDLADLFSAGARFAVLLFFVLSGFVLALPYYAGKNDAYVPYLVRRFFRLYPPFALAIFVASLLLGLSNKPSSPLLSGWLAEFWTVPLTPGLIASHMLMTDVHQSATILDRPIWTLIVEMRIALIFPLLILFVKRFGWPGVVASMVAAFLCSKIQAALGEPSVMVAESPAGSLFLTGRYVPFFLFGIITAASLDQYGKILNRVSRTCQGAIFICSVLLCVFLNLKRPGGDGYIDILYGLMAMYLIAVCAVVPAVSATLSARTCVWLGNISYSLYLIHLPVLLGIVILLLGHASLVVTMAVAVPSMLLIAHMMHYLIERPSMNLGRKLVARMPVPWKNGRA
ncbi:MAG: acyltransferase [Pseudomonadota bacterium]|nr:acyltransferase [Pseudomonadota bacterium]